MSYYDYPNSNGRQLNYGKTDEERAATLARAQTLKLMPVKAYYCTNADGEPTFGGHEVSYDENGNIIYGTEKIGVHYDVYIKTANVTAADGTKRRLPCLYAKQRIWSDKPHVIAAVKRLYGLGKLNTSWEMQVSSYEYKQGIKYLNEYEFTGNAMLGFDDQRHPNHPAYGQDAKVIALSSESEDQENYELMIAEALAKDLLEHKANIKLNPENEVEVMNENEKLESDLPIAEVSTEEQEVPEVPVEEAQTGVEAPTTEHSEQPAEAQEPSEQVETSALTMGDIMMKLNDVYRATVGHWGYCNYMWPEEHIAWMHHSDMLEAEYDQVTYSVNADAVVIDSIERVSIALPVRELSQQYVALKQQNEELSTSVATLTKYKEQYEAMEQAEAKKQHDAEVAALRTLVEESNCFTAEEISDMQSMIDNAQKLEIQAKIGERLMQQRKATPETSAAEQQPEAMPKAGLEQEHVPEAEDKVSGLRRWLYN